MNRPQHNRRKAEQIRKYTLKATILQHVFECAYSFSDCVACETRDLSVCTVAVFDNTHFNEYSCLQEIYSSHTRKAICMSSFCASYYRRKLTFQCLLRCTVRTSNSPHAAVSRCIAGRDWNSDYYKCKTPTPFRAEVGVQPLGD